MHIRYMYTQWGQILMQAGQSARKVVALKYLAFSEMLKSPQSFCRRRFPEAAQHQSLRCHGNETDERDSPRGEWWGKARRREWGKTVPCGGMGRERSRGSGMTESVQRRYGLRPSGAQPIKGGVTTSSDRRQHRFSPLTDDAPSPAAHPRCKIAPKCT